MSTGVPHPFVTIAGMEPAASPPDLPVFDDVLAAAARIAPHAHATPVLRSQSLDAIAGCELHFKCENFQRVGAFKFRGACNAVLALDATTAARGVITQSSGNHGAAIALACRLRGIPATVIVPEGAPAVKLAAIAGFGAEVLRCAPTMAARDAATAAAQAERGAVLIHPFDDRHVIAGQATAALELHREVPGLDAVVAPVGGGGLLAGTALATREVAPQAEVWGAEPAGAADAHASLARGEVITTMRADTLCDGLRGHLAPRTFTLIRDHARGILLADDAEVVQAMRLVWERLKIVVEPSCAVALAVVLRYPDQFRGRRVGIIVSGGNVDLGSLPWAAA